MLFFLFLRGIVECSGHTRVLARSKTANLMDPLFVAIGLFWAAGHLEDSPLAD